MEVLCPGHLDWSHYFVSRIRKREFSFQTSTPVLPTNEGINGPVEIGIGLRADARQLDIYRYNISVIFNPLHRADSNQVLSATGREDFRTNALIKMNNGFKSLN